MKLLTTRHMEYIPIIDITSFTKITDFWFDLLNIHNDIIQISYKYYFDYNGILLIYHYSNESGYVHNSEAEF